MNTHRNKSVENVFETSRVQADRLLLCRCDRRHRDGACRRDIPQREVRLLSGGANGCKLCTDPPPNPNHGAGLLLDPSISCEALPDAEPSINVIAGFNSIEKQNLEELKNYTCNGNGSRGTVPYGLTIPGHKTSSCLVKSGNGKVEVWIVAQVSTGAFIDGWINYEISLFTTEARLDKDLLTLRRVLGGIRLFRPL